MSNVIGAGNRRRFIGPSKGAGERVRQLYHSGTIFAKKIYSDAKERRRIEKANRLRFEALKTKYRSVAFHISKPETSLESLKHNKLYYGLKRQLLERFPENKEKQYGSWLQVENTLAKHFLILENQKKQKLNS